MASPISHGDGKLFDDVSAPHPAAATTASSDDGVHRTDTSDREALDDTFQVYKATEGLEISAEEAKRVVRKIDSRIVPILFGTYMLQYLDKSWFFCP